MLSVQTALGLCSDVVKSHRALRFRPVDAVTNTLLVHCVQTAHCASAIPGKVASGLKLFPLSESFNA